MITDQIRSTVYLIAPGASLNLTSCTQVTACTGRLMKRGRDVPHGC